MKKITVIFVLLCMSMTLFSCSKTSSTTESGLGTTLTKITAGQAATEDFSDEETTAKQMVFHEKNKVVLDNGSYRFEIEKTNFEDIYPEELLWQFVSMLSMDFGVEDYYDWNTSGQNIFSDVRKSSIAIFDCYKNYEFLDEQIDKEAYSMFLKDAGLEYNMYCEAFTFSLAKYNNYLKNFFGPDVRELTVEDFETGKTAVEKGLVVDGDIGESDTRCFYTGKDDIILIQVCATGFSLSGEYIYNVEKNGDDYYVYTIGDYELNGRYQNFAELQNHGLNDIPNTIYKGLLPTKKYKFGCAVDGDVYLKSVEKSFLVAENVEYDYMITRDAELKNKKANSEEYKVTGMIPKGTKVKREAMLGSWKNGVPEMYYVICENYHGNVNCDYVEEIES